MDFLHMKKYRKFKDEDIEFAHYDFCRNRLNSINTISKLVFAYNMLTALIIALFAWGKFSLVTAIFYAVLGIGMLATGCLGVRKNKYCNFAMVAFYILTTLFINVPIGLLGTSLYCVSIFNSFEKDILKDMSGYPIFSQRLDETNEEYAPMHDINNEGHYMENITRKTALGLPEEPAKVVIEPAEKQILLASLPKVSDYLGYEDNERDKQILLEDLPKIAEYLGDSQNPAYNKVYDLPPLEDIRLAPSSKELYINPNAKISLEKKTDKRKDGEI